MLDDMLSKDGESVARVIELQAETSNDSPTRSRPPFDSTPLFQRRLSLTTHVVTVYTTRMYLFEFKAPLLKSSG